MSVTLRDVARTAGVSVKTVSRVVNNQGEISEETRQRIKGVVREMGYRPNLVARGLVTQRTRTIGLIVPDITNPFFPEIAKGVQDACRLQDYNVYLCNSGESQQEELRALNSLAAQGVDGVLHLGFGVEVEVAGVLVEQQEAGLFVQGARQQQTLFLPA